MSVMPLAAVFDTATTGVLPCWAMGSAAVAVVERVGPMMALTLSRLMKRWKTAMPCSLEVPSSSRTSSSVMPFSLPLLFTSSMACRTPDFCWAP